MRENVSVCGTDCSVCYCFGKMCNGCNSCEGKCFMHRKEKLVRFMTVLETVNVCKTVENVVMCLVRYGLIPETRSFQMKNLVKM